MAAVTCGKIPFPTKKEADKAARGLSAKKFRGWRGRPFVRSYQCQVCSGERAVWHVTRSKPGRRS